MFWDLNTFWEVQAPVKGLNPKLQCYHYTMAPTLHGDFCAIL
jgi:hypothetical protein